MRLVNNSTTYEGLVQVKYSGRWGYICGHNWNDIDAEVIITLATILSYF